MTVCVEYNIHFTQFYITVDRTSHEEGLFLRKQMDFEFGSSLISGSQWSR